MQWKQIKTLFILCFVILDAYLLFMFFDKQEASDVGYEDTTDSTLEQQLEAENITISADLPEDELSESYISVNPKEFTEEEIASLDEADNQDAYVIDDNLIVSRFDSPVAIPDGAGNSLISKLVKSEILLPDNYTFGTWNEDMNVLVFFQQKNDRPIYYNQKGIVLVYLNDDNEMMFYTQTMLGEADSLSEAESLIEPMQAIEVLFNDNRLWSGDEITSVNMGFHTRIPLSSGEQVFAPTWTVTVDGEENFYVNAIENLVFSSNELTFLKNAIPESVKSIQKLDDDNAIKDFVVNQLNHKLSSNQQSE